MDVELIDGKLKLIVGKEASAVLDHWQFDTFQSVWAKAWWGEGIVAFQLNAITGEVESINVDGAVLRREAKAK